MTFLYMNNESELVEWPSHAFGPEALERLENFLADKRVIPLRDVFVGFGGEGTIAMRHDVDHSLTQAFKFARWEHEHGWRSSYYLLHSAWYWEDFGAVEAFIKHTTFMGHEVGIHNDAVCQALRTNRFSAHEILNEALALLRDYYDVKGAADHGGVGANNTELWKRYELSDFDLWYEAYQLKNKEPSTYISDNGGVLGAPLAAVTGRQTHMLIHPCHWNIDEYYQAA
jgi:hypothetical protein